MSWKLRGKFVWLNELAKFQCQRLVSYNFIYFIIYNFFNVVASDGLYYTLQFLTYNSLQSWIIIFVHWMLDLAATVELNICYYYPAQSDLINLLIFEKRVPRVLKPTMVKCFILWCDRSTSKPPVSKNSVKKSNSRYLWRKKLSDPKMCRINQDK